MALVRDTTYQNIFYDYVLKGLKSIINTDLSHADVYVAESIQNTTSFQVKLWGVSSTDIETWTSAHLKTYNVDIAVYMIESNPTEKFYEEFYARSERMYQLLFNNQTKAITVGSKELTWIDANVESIIYNDFAGDEVDVDGLHKISYAFNCKVERED